MAVLGQSHRAVKIKFSKFFYQGFNTGHQLTFLSKFLVDLSRYKEKQLHCTHYQTPTFSPQFCAPLAQGAKILRHEI